MASGVFRLKPLDKLKGVKDFKVRALKLAKPVGGETSIDLRDDTAKEVWDRLGRQPRDWKLAQRVATLMRTYPNGTVPELVAMDWLNQMQIPFIYLAQIYGGHARKGGVEVDLLFEQGGVGVAWLVHGNYWHSRPEVSESDVGDKLRFLGATYHGIKIEKVVALWERKIYFCRPQVFEQGLAGIELGQ
jgi:hypothetical protein